MREAPTRERKGILKRISFKAKLIAILVILVVAAFALVAAFAAGFATGSMIATTSQRDVCIGIDGTWSEENSICYEPAAFAPEPPESVVATTSYSCGDGSSFVLETVTTNTVRLVPGDGSAPRILDWEDPTANITTWTDGQVSLTLVGPEGQYRDAAKGTNVSCALR